jgi:hypothetical protein
MQRTRPWLVDTLIDHGTSQAWCIRRCRMLPQRRKRSWGFCAETRSSPSYQCKETSTGREEYLLNKLQRLQVCFYVPDVVAILSCSITGSLRLDMMTLRPSQNRSQTDGMAGVQL